MKAGKLGEIATVSDSLDQHFSSSFTIYRNDLSSLGRLGSAFLFFLGRVRFNMFVFNMLEDVGDLEVENVI
jgi:hypothetical protein